MAVAIPTVSSPPWAPSNTVSNPNDPNTEKINMRATMKPTSPTRLTMKAFLPAAAAVSRSNQNEISK